MKREDLMKLDLKSIGDKVTVARSRVKMVFDPRGGESEKTGKAYESIGVVLENGMTLQAWKGDSYFDMFADTAFKNGDVLTIATEDIIHGKSFGEGDKQRVSVNPENFEIIGYEVGDKNLGIEGFTPSGIKRETTKGVPKTPSSSSGKGAEAGGAVNPEEI